jgi:hypothetical protein
MQKENASFEAIPNYINAASKNGMNLKKAYSHRHLPSSVSGIRAPRNDAAGAIVNGLESRRSRATFINSRPYNARSDTRIAARHRLRSLIIQVKYETFRTAQRYLVALHGLRKVMP